MKDFFFIQSAFEFCPRWRLLRDLLTSTLSNLSSFIPTHEVLLQLNQSMILRNFLSQAFMAFLGLFSVFFIITTCMERGKWLCLKHLWSHKAAVKWNIWRPMSLNSAIFIVLLSVLFCVMFYHSLPPSQNLIVSILFSTAKELGFKNIYETEIIVG